MRIALLTSSRADYGIYLPLLKRLRADAFFELNIIAFGTHLSSAHGKTVEVIEADGFEVKHRIDTLPKGDTPADISKSMGQTTILFSELWRSVKADTDVVLCLGDRYEMFAAVAAAVPFMIPIAHIHGGEVTLGAMDNVFRHSLTHMAAYHFASTAAHADRIKRLKENNDHIYNTGALGLDNLNDLKLMDREEFSAVTGIPVNKPVLVTFHPETVAYEKNGFYVDELIRALEKVDGQIIITMPNADTSSGIVRERLSNFADSKAEVYTVESLGTRGYFSCMDLCDFMIGNSSSGIIEAASFGKYVIDLGERQKGRETGRNVVHCEINTETITDAMRRINQLPHPGTLNVYGDGKASEKIITAFKEISKLQHAG
jgi:GDP/UDP-N,N'-diacetylbacillosamine 2-epimerase (hydrolysing)